VDEGPAHVIFQSGLFRQREASFQLLPALRHSGEELHRADVVEGVDDHIRVTACFGEVERPRPPSERLIEPLVVHVHSGEDAVRLRQLPARRLPLEQAQRLQPGRLGVSAAAAAPQPAGEL
jgi:hypothetical protein